MTSAVELTDDLVKEYLAFRGFTNTLKYFEADIKADKDKGFRVDRIVEQLLQFVQSYDLNGLVEYWAYMERRLFSRLEDVYRPTINKLKTSLFRYYLVYTIQSSRTDKAHEFFQKQATELQNQAEWKEWFALPFLPAPDSNRTFSTYFSRQWADTFTVSLHNFLSVLFQCMPVPKILTFQSDYQKIAFLQEENEVMRQKAQKAKELVGGTKEVRSSPNVLGVPGTDATVVQQRQKRQQERRELLSKTASQSTEKKTESLDLDPDSRSDAQNEPVDSASRGSGGSSARKEEKSSQPFIVLSQDEYAEHHSSIMHCRVDCSGRRVASLDVDGVIKIWSIDGIMQTKASAISKSALLSLEWATKRDRLLLLGSEVGTVRLYDTEAKKNLCEIGIVEDMPRILSLACSPSGASFVCSAASATSPSQTDPTYYSYGENGSNQVPGKLLLWDTKTMKQQLQFSLEPVPIAVNCTAFNHNGNLLVTGAADGFIRLFDMQQHQCALSWKAHMGEVYSVDFSYDENAVYSIGEDGKFIQWDIHKSGQKVSEYSLPPDATGPFMLSGYSGYKQVQFPRGRLFAFDSEGKYMLTCSNTGGVIYKLNSDGSTLENCLSLGGHRAPVVTVDWSTAVECGTCLTASMDGKIRLTTLLAQKS
ncbi:hypothetical protein XELAEV_18016721mg [Xenopus laevis]|uniref:WD repeat-containing protein 91 n=1 Tax=Xenopus laevis TaxID=8355 RepID=A0A974D9V6_XENLA|nr:hypothetical protein XELAEV_18016721mg [Xenopus laevis]